MKGVLKNSNFLEKIKSLDNYDLFIKDNYFLDIQVGKLFVALFGTYFSKYRISQHFKYEELISNLINQYSLDKSQVIRYDRAMKGDIFKPNFNSSTTILILKERLMIEIGFFEVDIYYSPDTLECERNELIQIIDRFRVIELDLKKCYLIKKDRGSFQLTDFDLRPFELDVESHYNDDFLNIHNLIYRSLNKQGKNGLILLHGKYGTGKTFYLRYLMNKIERRFIYFPLGMLEWINSPELFPFLSEYPNSVLVLEDCENLLMHRENGNSNASAISNLLNLGDGLLSDALSLNVICTFNAGLKKIDDAILRKGRLIARYEFKELELSKAQSLAKHIGKNAIIEKPMTVSDIYNIEDKSFENTQPNAIGFKAA